MSKSTYEELEKRVKELEKAEAEGMQTEKLLRENEKNYRSIVEYTPVLLCVFNKSLVLTFVNDVYCKYFGKKRDELIGKKFLNLIPEEDREFVKENITSLTSANPIQSHEHTAIGRNGVVRWQKWTNRAIFNENGELTVYHSFGEDITERKKAEEVLRRSETRSEKMFSLSPDMICVCSPEGKFLRVSPSCEEILGYTIDEVLELGWAYLVHPDDVERTNKEVEGQLKGNSVMNYVNRFKCKDGTYKLLEWRATPVIDGIVYATARDITEQKQLEEQLQIRQRMDSIGTLAGGIAHDFNNILVGIMGNINMLNMGNDNFTESQKGRLTDAEQSCVRAASLITQFQTLSRASVAGQSAVDIHDISNEVFKLLKETTDQLISKQIKFKKGEYCVAANPTELHQVLLNLATNSAHAIEERGTKNGDYIRINAKDFQLTTGGRMGLEEGDYVHITVEDNGAGMSNEVSKKVFDPMFTTKDKGVKSGQGLGLAMVYNIVTKIYKGHIYFDSKEGKGTTFHLYLPKAQPETELDAKVTSDIKGGTETILVVDDEPLVVKLARNLLTDFGYTVLTARDGKEAMNIYEKQKDSIDAVLLDLTIPYIPGRVVLKELLDVNPDVKVIISSGHSDEVSQKGILAKAKGNIRKPYKIRDMARTIRTVLDS